MYRPSFTEQFLDIAEVVSRRATCPRRSVGAVITKDNIIISTGYNGSEPGSSHCLDVGCLMVDNHCKRTIHAEDNAIRNCSNKEGLIDSKVYIYGGGPCLSCSYWLIENGLKEIHCFSHDGKYINEDWNRYNFKLLMEKGVSSFVHMNVPSGGGYVLVEQYIGD